MKILNPFVDGFFACASLAAILGLALPPAQAGTAPALPVGAFRSLQVTTPGLTNRYLRHKNGSGQAMTGIVNTESTNWDRLDATFRIDAGLADPACVSLESNDFPGRYLRHQNGLVMLSDRASDAYPGVFDQDATWCPVPGLAGSGISLRSKNNPDKYLRHANGLLVLTDASVFPWSFDQDATWKLATALTDAAPVAYPGAGGVRGAGALPAIAAKVDYLGEISTDTAFPRDIGFSGVVNGRIVWTFADSFAAAAPFICSSNSAAWGDFAHPLQIVDKNLRSNGCPQEWVPFAGGEVAQGLGRWADWITNVVEFAPDKGLVYFAEQDRGSPGCNAVSPCLHGAGVATVTADDDGPVATRAAETMWNPFEPRWGDIGAAYDPTDGFVYVMGHGPADANVYLAKAPAAGATDVSKYQYFDNSTKTWTATRFTDDGRLGTVKVADAKALFTYHAVGQSYPFWSNWFNTWMMVYGDEWGTSDVHVMTAPRLEGPWTKQAAVDISTCPPAVDCSRDGADQLFHYAIAGHPEFDPSGKTLVVTWTRLPNKIHMKKITWQ